MEKAAEILKPILRKIDFLNELMGDEDDTLISMTNPLRDGIMDLLSQLRQETIEILHKQRKSISSLVEQQRMAWDGELTGLLSSLRDEGIDPCDAIRKALKEFRETTATE